MNKIILAAKLWHLPVTLALCTASSSAMAFPGGNNSFFGSNNGCGTDWPAWTPMYWMEEMADMMGNGNNNNCFPNQAYGAYPPQAYNPYAASTIPPQTRQYQAATYPNSYQRRAYVQRAASPYGLAQNPALRRSTSPWSGMTSRTSGLPFSSAFGGQRGGFSNLFGGRRSSGFSPFSSGFGSSNPFSSMSPMSSFGSPFGGGMSPMGMGMNPMSMGGMGMPGMSPMSGMGMPGINPMSMGGMGMPGMSPMGGMGMSPMSGFSPFGGSPFGGSSFMPKF